MIDRAVFYARLAVCRQCVHWRGACLKGHALQYPPGCPEQKFAGVDGADFMADRPAPEPVVPGGTGCPGCASRAAEPLASLTWPEVWQHLQQSVAEWGAAGFPMASTDLYLDRINICKACPRDQYVLFQCRHCRCCVYTKAKLATERCPYGYW
jgi:hypothetical protein